MLSYFPQRGLHNYSKPFKPYDYKSLKDLWSIVGSYTYSPIVFKNNHRLGSNFIHADLCILDVDNDGKSEPLSLESAKRALEGLKYLIGSTRNHMISKNGEPPAERFRIIVPWEKRLDNPDDYKASIKKAIDTFDGVDKVAKDIARQFYPCKQILAFSDGDLMPVAKADPVVIQRQRAKHAYYDLKSIDRPLPRHIVQFLNEGRVFGGSRNISIYQSANHLLKKGLTLNDAMSLIRASPFIREDLSDREIEYTVTRVFRQKN